MWNNRIIKHKKNKTVWYSVHEVFYNKDGGIYAHTEDPITIVGETEAEAVEQAEERGLATPRGPDHLCIHEAP